MALERYFLACKKISILKIYMTRTSGDRKESVFEGCLGLQPIYTFGIDISEAATSWCWFSFSGSSSCKFWWDYKFSSRIIIAAKWSNSCFALSIGGYNRWIEKNEGFGWEVLLYEFITEAFLFNMISRLPVRLMCSSNTMNDFFNVIHIPRNLGWRSKATLSSSWGNENMREIIWSTSTD
jgi:hypothetical protein